MEEYLLLMDRLTGMNKCTKMFNINALQLGVINYGFHHMITLEKCYCVIKRQDENIFKKINIIESIEKNTFIRKYKLFFENTLNDIDTVPILMFDDYNMYWMEYVWIVCISNDINIGIS